MITIHLDTILSELDRAGLKLNVGKCKFFVNEVKFLEYIVSQHGIKIDKQRLDEIRNYRSF